MRTLIICVITLFVFCSASAQWTQKTSLPAASRIGSAAFVIGTTGYIAGGRDANLNYLNELWAYDTQSDSWTQKAGFPGGGLLTPGGFSINNMGYISCGWLTGSTPSSALLKYDPSLNSWTTLAPLPAPGRYGPTSFVINNKVYVGCGYGPLYDDLWEYDPVVSVWTQKASFSPGPRQAFVNFSIDGFGYVGSGLDQNGLSNGYTGLTDFYKYDPLLNSWSSVSSMPGNPRHSAFSFVIGNKAIVGCGLNGNGATATLYNDFYEYNATADTWQPIQAFPGFSRQSGAYFAVGNCGYMFGGFSQGPSGPLFYNELWQYCAPVGITENENQSPVEINYAHETRCIHLKYNPTFKGNLIFHLMDATGKKLLTKEIKSSSPASISEDIPVPFIANGIYLYTLQSAKAHVQSGKLIVN